MKNWIIIVITLLLTALYVMSVRQAFNGYVACLHQLYLMGAAMQLKRMGYHMTKMS